MASITTPIRLVLFESKKCTFCPNLERIVMKIVGTSTLKDMVYLSIINLDVNPEAAKEYPIHQLPLLVMNEKVVLRGKVEEELVEELLWNELMNQVGASVKVDVEMKSSLLGYTMISLNSINKSKLLRPTIGDYVHIGTFQLMLLSLYSLDPLMPQLLYRSGFKLGMYGILHHVLNILNPKLGRTHKRKFKFVQLGKAFEIYFSDRGAFDTRIAERAEIVEITKNTIYLKVYGMASASFNINIGEPVCGFTAGQLAGVTSLIMGTKSSCEELKCMANGANHCLFKISIDDEFKELENPVLEGKNERDNRRENFYEIIHEITPIIEDSLLMKRFQRPIVGDYVHLSVLQPIIIALKFIDKYSAFLLYSSGRELGIYGPGKELLYQQLYDKQIEGLVSPKKGVQLLYEYLTHPTSYLRREYGKITLREGEDENTFYFEIQDLASISGMAEANFGQTFCGFHAGFFAGRLQILIGVLPTITETKCQGKGDPVCEFQIKIPPIKDIME